MCEQCEVIKARMKADVVGTPTAVLQASLAHAKGQLDALSTCVKMIEDELEARKTA